MLPLAVTVLVISSVAKVPTVAQTQSLGELAAREKERRKGLTARLYTDEDLRHASQQQESYTSTAAADPATVLPAVAGGVAGPKEGEGAKSENDLRAEREKAWRERLQKAQDDVTRFSADIERLQLGLNDLSQNLYGAGRRAQIERLESAKGQLVAAQQSVGDLEEEGRRSSFR